MQDSIEVITEEIGSAAADTLTSVSYTAENLAMDANAAPSYFQFVFLILGLALFAFIIMIHWKIYTKAGRKGWESIIPFYNIYVFFQIIGVSMWNLLWFLFPIVGVIVMLIKINSALAKSFGKGGGFTVGLIFLALIFQAILAFDSSIVYAGPNGVNASSSGNNGALDNDI